MKSANKLHKVLFKWFKPYMVQLAYSPPEFPEILTFAFQDQAGKRWFECKEIPIIRKLKIAEAFMKVYTGVTDRDLSVSLEAIEAAINEQQNGKMRPNIALVSHICKTLLSRKGYVIDLDSVYNLAALYYVMDGESPEWPDDNLIPTKIEALKKTDISKFFFSQSLDKLFPFLNDYEGTIQEVAEVCQIESESFLNHLKSYQND